MMSASLCDDMFRIPPRPPQGRGRGLARAVASVAGRQAALIEASRFATLALAAAWALAELALLIGPA